MPGCVLPRWRAAMVWHRFCRNSPPSLVSTQLSSEHGAAESAETLRIARSWPAGCGGQGAPAPPRLPYAVPNCSAEKLNSRRFG